MRAKLLMLAWLLPLVSAVGLSPCLSFPEDSELVSHPSLQNSNNRQQSFSAEVKDAGFIIAQRTSLYSVPIITDSNDDEAVHIAVQNFALDVERTTGVLPRIINYSEPLAEELRGGNAIVVGTVSSSIARAFNAPSSLQGQWESYHIQVEENHQLDGVGTVLAVSGSDRRGTIYALYTLSEEMGVSPWHWWADVPPRQRSSIVFPSGKVCAHGEPSVKYRGIFINDEVPVLWNFAREHFNISWPEGPFQTGIYDKMFELILRLKGNYLWPSMYFSMFAVDGLNPQVNGLPKSPIPGPNQVLANKVGVVMGTSHHEPMSRTKPEWDLEGHGSWDWTNNETLIKWWEYGAERARTCETVYTMGLRGDGDKALDGASKELLEHVVDIQQDILKQTYEKNSSSSADYSKMWCMYKEVQGYFAEGLKVPDDVTIMFADDNYGNIMQVLDPELADHPAGAGIYYHADYHGRPRDWKWINVVNIVKTWEQLNVARSFHTDRIWILNVGDLKNHELPTDHFLTMAYDFERWPRNSMGEYLRLWAARDFGEEVADEVAEIMTLYGIYSGRRHGELLSPLTFSSINYDEASQVATDWSELVSRAQAVYDQLPEERKASFFEVVLSHTELLANLNEMYISVAKNNLYSQQALVSTNRWAHKAIKAFENDYEISERYHHLLGGKWPHIMDQTHINFQLDDWMYPMRNTLPPVSFVNPHVPSQPGPGGVRPGQPAYVRVTIENSMGSWPDHNFFNCYAGDCSPVLPTIDPYGVQQRWIMINSAGPKDVAWSAETEYDWLSFEPPSGIIKADGSSDVKVILIVDWDRLRRENEDDRSYPKNATVQIIPDDGSNVTVTLPISIPSPPHEDFHGFVEGDGYVSIPAAHFAESSPSSDDKYAFEEIINLGRTGSGIAIFPVDATNHSMGQGPQMRYDFWTHSAGEANLSVLITPSLNFLSGKKLAYAYQIDESEPQVLLPVPQSLPPPAQAVPPDWDKVVSDNARSVNTTITLGSAGKHSLTIHGMTAGVVFEKILIDLGGIERRGYSYLGPPESMRID